MNKKNILLILIFSFVLVLSGCSNSDGTKTSSSGDVGKDFVSGNGGIEINFAENAPPEEIFDGDKQSFFVRLELQNKGETDIETGTANIKLGGLDLEAFGIDDNVKKVPFLRKTRKIDGKLIEPAPIPVIFPSLRYKDILAASYEVKLTADICYPYKTNAVVLFCVNGDTSIPLDKDAVICDVNNDKNQIGNSAAPVKINNFKQFGVGDGKIGFQFDIIHTPLKSGNNAILYQSESFDSNCDINGKSATGLDALDRKNKVKFTINSGLSGLDCGGTGTNVNTITLINDKQSIYCEQDVTNLEEYEKPFNIKIEYDYFNRISTPIKIKHLQR